MVDGTLGDEANLAQRIAKCLFEFPLYMGWALGLDLGELAHYANLSLAEGLGLGLDQGKARGLAF